MIKPNAVAAGATEAILDQARAAGFKVVCQQVATLSKEQAEEFYGEHNGKPFFEALVTFMTSGPIVKLILEKEGAILGWRALLGPTNSLTAKTDAPESIRAIYGIDGTQNAAHGSDSPESAAREIGLMLPTESTLAIIKSHAPDEVNPAPGGEEKVLQLLRAEGYTVSSSGIVTVEEATAVVGADAGLPAAPEEGEPPVTLTKLELTKAGAVAAAAGLDLKADLSFAYFSPDAAKAAEDIDALFPVQKTVAIIKPGAVGSSDQIQDAIGAAGFTVVKGPEEATLSKGAAEVFYSEHKEADFFEELTESMSSGPVIKLVLEKRGAVAAWRDLIGPTDPEAAKDPEGESYAPDSLRAKFGTSALENAVHGSKDADAAAREEGVLFAVEMSAEEAAMPVEQTYAMIKPDACGAGNAEAIILLAENNGFKVVQRKDEEALEEDQVKEFYAEHAEKDFFETLVGFMTSGPVVKLVLERPNAIKAWRCAPFVQGSRRSCSWSDPGVFLCPGACWGRPTRRWPRQRRRAPSAPSSATVRPRHRFATVGLGPHEFCVCTGEDPDVATQNAAHGSDAVASAEREIGIMFPPEAEPEAEAEEEE